MRLTIGAAVVAAALAGPAHAQGDPEKGRTAFNQCRACHSLDAGKNSVGPSLNGVFGRQLGTAPKFSYSAAVKEAGEKGLKWDEKTMSDYLADPKAFLQKVLGKDAVANKMPNKFPNAAFRADVIAYLKQAAK